MSAPKITEERLTKLLGCLANEFSNEHAGNTHRLPDKIFYLTDRLGCCKNAGLNYEYTSKNNSDVVTVISSQYVEAIKELAHRGHVSFKDNNLTFVLTEKGLEVGSQKITKKIGKWTMVKTWANEHQGIVAILALLATIAALAVSYLSMPNS